MASIREKIEREVTGWPGVEEEPHRFAGAWLVARKKEGL